MILGKYYVLIVGCKYKATTWYSVLSLLGQAITTTTRYVMIIAYRGRSPPRVHHGTGATAAAAAVVLTSCIIPGRSSTLTRRVLGAGAYLVLFSQVTTRLSK